MALTSKPLILERHPTSRPRRKPSADRPAVFVFWPRTRATPTIAGGGWVMGGAIVTGSPVIAMHPVGSDGFLFGGAISVKNNTFVPVVGATGGFTMGGAATSIRARELTDILVYPTVESLTPQVNADDVDAQLPQVYE